MARSVTSLRSRRGFSPPIGARAPTGPPATTSGTRLCVWRAPCSIGSRVLQRAYAASRASPRVRPDEPRILFGDSTPFPYGLEFLDALRTVVDCCVDAARRAARDRSSREALGCRSRTGLKAERSRLEALLEAVRKAAAPYVGAPASATNPAADVMVAARAIVERERTDRRAALVGRAAARPSASSTTRAASPIRRSRRCCCAVTPPQSSIGWRLVADADGYDAQVRLAHALRARGAVRRGAARRARLEPAAPRRQSRVRD